MAQTLRPRHLPPSLLAVTLVIFCLVGAADIASAEDAEAPPFIGIAMGGSSDGGTRVDRVIPGTAAEKFGLAAGDVILRIDDTRTDSPRRVRYAIASLRPGDEIEMELLRSGDRRTMRLELGPRPDELELRRDQADHVLEVLQLRPGLDVADVGCGSGWLSEAIATELDGSGKVYAVELDEGHVDNLRRRALPGIVPVLSEAGDVSLPEDSLDVALLHDVASHIDPDARESFYLSMRRALRRGGRLVVFGPHGEAETMLEVLRANGFVPLDDGLAMLDADELDQRLLEGIVFRPVPEESSPER
jgi:SAM-dependent methyltransferase